MHTLAVGVALLLFSGGVAANPLITIGATQQVVDLQTSTRGALVEGLFRFEVAETQETYLKVLPTTTNPAYQNGTAGHNGWWTGLRLEDPAGTLHDEDTIGKGTIEFGILRPGKVHTLHVRVHIPAGAIAEPATYHLDYALAARAVAENGSGAVRDPSVGLRVVVLVEQGAESSVQSGGTTSSPPLLFLLLGGILLLAAAASAAVAVGRRRKRALPAEQAPFVGR